MPSEEFTGLSPNMAAFASRRRAQNVERAAARAMKTEDILKEMALAFGDGPLFASLRQSYAESDPAFRARMEAMTYAD